MVFSDNPFHWLRAQLTRGLQVGTSDAVVTRGGEIEAVVTISKLGKLGDVHAGLVCTEAYSTRSMESDENNLAQMWATAHESWVPVDGTAGVHRVRLVVPPDAPYSYKGGVLSFKWEVVARGVRKLLDARAAQEITVLP
ncbi:MAG: hypothetical protein ACRD12_03860 [Acidimicrobiales bacterium]